MAPVRVAALSKQFEAFKAVNAIDFSIRDGEFVFFLGPSGCGKTTTLRMIAGLLMPSGGCIEIGRRDVTYLRPRYRNVGMVFQQNVLYGHLSVFDNLAYPLRVRGLNRASLRKKVEDVARTLQIDDVLQRMPDQLSGGQSQRVAIGRMLVREADVFLMDEPISHLDAKLRAHMRAELRHLQKQLGVTTLFVSHDQLEAMSMADRIMVMNEGVIQQFAPPQEIFDSPVNLFVAGFVGEPHMNTIEVTLVAGEGAPMLTARGFRLAAPTGWLEDGLAAQRGGHFVLGVRPEQVRLAASACPDSFEAKLYAVEPLGAEDLMTVEYAGGFIQARVPTEEATALPSRPGSGLHVSFNPDHLYLFDMASGRTVAQARFTRS
jgi:multiple sugar transport system ATP-binding protein